MTTERISENDLDEINEFLLDATGACSLFYEQRGYWLAATVARAERLLAAYRASEAEVERLKRAIPNAFAEGWGAHVAACSHLPFVPQWKQSKAFAALAPPPAAEVKP